MVYMVYKSIKIVTKGSKLVVMESQQHGRKNRSRDFHVSIDGSVASYRGHQAWISIAADDTTIFDAIGIYGFLGKLFGALQTQFEIAAENV